MGWKRWLIILVLLALIAARLVWPETKVDTLTAFLVAAAAVIFVMPELGNALPKLIPYVGKIKVAGIEIELREQVQKIAQEVQEAVESIGEKTPLEIPSNVSPEVNTIMEEAGKDPRAALLLLSAKLEQRIRERTQQAGLVEGTRVMPLPRLVEVGVRNGLFPQEIMPAFRDFWAVRNRIAHGGAFDVEDYVVLSVVSIGTELLRMVSAEKPRE